MPIRLSIADDHGVVRHGIEMCLAAAEQRGSSDA
jgi:hypothetical protein